MFYLLCASHYYACCEFSVRSKSKARSDNKEPLCLKWLPLISVLGYRRMFRKRDKDSYTYTSRGKLWISARYIMGSQRSLRRCILVLPTHNDSYLTTVEISWLHILKSSSPLIVCSDTPTHVQVFPFLLIALRIFTLLKQNTQYIHHCTVQCHLVSHKRIWFDHM